MNTECTQDQKLRQITLESGKVVRMQELVPGARFHMQDDDQSLGWWTATSAPTCTNNVWGIQCVSDDASP